MRYMPSAERPLPFWTLSTPGGDTSDVGSGQPLRGFGAGRFYDRDRLSASGEVRHTFWGFDAICARQSGDGVGNLAAPMQSNCACITGLSIDERRYFSYFFSRMAAWFWSSCVKSLLTEITGRHPKFRRQSFSSILGLVCRCRRLKPLGLRTERSEPSSTRYVPMRQSQASIPWSRQKTRDPRPLHPLIG